MKEYLANLFNETAQKLNYLKDIEIRFTTPSLEIHGDLSTNAAMLLTKTLKKNPREIAKQIISALDYDSQIIQKIEIAGPGFINFYFAKDFTSKIIERMMPFDEYWY